MATVCKLSATFHDPLTLLYEMFLENTEEAGNWGTKWDIVEEQAFPLVDGNAVRLVWGFTSAYARMDGMGGHVTFTLKFTQFDYGTTIDVTVSSPYEGSRDNSAYYRRNHQVALRLLEFCVAPYGKIHPRVGTLKRIADSLRTNPIERTTS